MKKHILRALALAFAVITALGATACQKSPYPDATETVPSTWKNYSAGALKFRFEAGFTPAETADFSDILDKVGAAAGAESTFTTLRMWQSPARDKNTNDFLLAGYFTVSASVTAKDLEAIMPHINAISDSRDLYDQLKMLQSAQIRIFGSTEALTFTTRLTQNDTTLVLQFALVPSGPRLYTFVYADFTTGTDGLYIKRLLSSLAIE